MKLGNGIAEVRRFPPAQLRPRSRAAGLAGADWMTARDLAFEWHERPPLNPEPRKT